MEKEQKITIYMMVVMGLLKSRVEEALRHAD